MTYLYNKIKHQPWVEIVNLLNESEKMTIWLKYVAKTAAFKHDFMWVDKKTVNWGYGLGNPHSESLSYAFYYLWKGFKISDFDSFTAKENIIIRDMGEDWELNQNAQRYSVSYCGIYEWYNKYELI